MGDEITARFGYKNDPIREVESVRTDDFDAERVEGLDRVDHLDGEHMVHKMNLSMDPEAMKKRIDLMSADLWDGLYTEDQLNTFFDVR